MSTAGVLLLLLAAWLPACLSLPSSQHPLLDKIAFDLAEVKDLLLARGVVAAGGQWDEASAFAALKDFASTVNRFVSGAQRPTCKLRTYGVGYGGHVLCTREPAHRPCYFYSFGIEQDYSFDVDYSKSHNCTGIGLDPSVTHPSTLPTPAGARVFFLNVAAKSLEDESNAMWGMVSSVPSLRRWLNHQHISVLKMDCEGCEFSLARDVLLEDPSFFDRVDQFAFELHVPRKWVKTKEHAMRLGQLYLLLTKSGLQLQDVTLSSCAPVDEATGCHPEIISAGFPCDLKKRCHNYLFARPDKAHRQHRLHH